VVRRQGPLTGKMAKLSKQVDLIKLHGGCRNDRQTKKKPARRPVLLALLAELLGGSSRSSFGSGSSRSSFGSGSGGSSRSSFGSGSGRSGKQQLQEREQEFFFLATASENGEQGGEQDGIFHFEVP